MESGLRSPDCLAALGVGWGQMRILGAQVHSHNPSLNHNHTWRHTHTVPQQSHIHCLLLTYTLPLRLTMIPCSRAEAHPFLTKTWAQGLPLRTLYTALEVHTSHFSKHTHAPMHMGAHTYTCTHACTHACTRACTHACMYTQKCNAWAHLHMHRITKACVFSHTNPHMLTAQSRGTIPPSCSLAGAPGLRVIPDMACRYMWTCIIMPCDRSRHPLGSGGSETLQGG